MENHNANLANFTASYYTKKVEKVIGVDFYPQATSLPSNVMLSSSQAWYQTLKWEKRQVKLFSTSHQNEI